MGGVNLTGAAEGNAVLYGGRAAKAGRAKKRRWEMPQIVFVRSSFPPAYFACFFLPGVKNGSLGGLAFFLRHACV